MNKPSKNINPQKEVTWYLAVRRLDLWIASPDREPYQPDSIWVYNLDLGLVQAVKVTQPSPEPAEILDLFLQAMEEPPPSIQAPPHHPTRLYLEDAVLFPILKPIADAYHIEISHHPQPDAIDEVVDEMARHLSEKADEALPGLLSQEGVTPPLIRDLFKAAAQFYLAAPWNLLNNFQTLGIQVLPDPHTYVVLILGYAGMEYGLNIFQSWEEFEVFNSQASGVEEKLPADGLLVMYFDDASYLPPADLKDIKRYRWQVINKQNYPIPLILNSAGLMKRPDRQDIHLLETVLWAIPPFLAEHLKPDQQGDYHPVQATISIVTQEGKKEISITYPAGKLSHKDLPSSPLDWESETGLADEGGFSGIVDRRAMEGMWGFFGDKFEGQDQNRAQELMYKAWDEQNPAKRLILAHQALSISPDCADAYVLLAEEEADTYEEALGLYQEGVRAGERALGKTYFQENEGHFWGLLITRPYMRARTGLAGTLRALGQLDEAIVHYREMLRLNPMDNQGNRYLLLLMLMELNLGKEADALLKEHQEDWSAEWTYTRALRLFQEHGQSKISDQALTEALDQNPHVPSYLLGQKRIPHQPPPGIILGDESEAINYSAAYLAVWRKTPGSLDWLKTKLN